MKKADQYINILMGSFVGVFLGDTISRYASFRSHPDLYVSAPWYGGLAVKGAIPAAFPALCPAIELVIGKKTGRGA